MYKQKPKSPSVLKMRGDLNKDGKMSSWETARQNAIEKNSPANMMATPLKQSTPQEYAFLKSQEDKKKGKSTRVIDKFTSAIQAPFSDKTYAELKKEKRAEQKKKYEASQKKSSVAKNYKKGYYGV
jgi:hypothetical protein